MWTLARWLGPWADEQRSPSCAGRRDVVVDARGELVLSLYEDASRRPRSVFVVAQGLHFLGPDDPRMDRFCRVLAAAGHLVVAPHLRDFRDLSVAPRAVSDLAAACQFAREESARRGLAGHALFSISFGSLPALAVAADREHGRGLSKLVLFGGYARFDVAVRFAVTGRVAGDVRAHGVPHDPLNGPVVYLALLDHWPEPVDREALRRALRAMVERTWGRAELKEGRRREPIASELAAALDPATRALFLEACGLSPLRPEPFEQALAASRERYRFADAAPYLRAIEAPVVIVHGRDDDVIPWTEAGAIAAELPSSTPREVVVTGLYGHTGAALPSVRALGRELSSMLRVLRALA